MREPDTLRSLADKCGLRLGACANAQALANDPTYAQTLAREFNTLTPENALKFAPICKSRNEYDFTDADRLVAFSRTHGMQVRGHVLVWDSQLPRWLTEANFSRSELTDILIHHISTLVTRYADQIDTWDVVNEAVDDNGCLRQNFWYKGIGPQYIDIAFQAARDAAPAAHLFYNDYGAEGTPEHQDGVYRLVSELTGKGIPLTGVGLQMHLSVENSRPPVDIRRLNNLGLAVHITELDVRRKLGPSGAARSPGEQTPSDRTQSYAQQAATFAAVFNDYILEGGCDTLILWGFTDRYSWIPFFYPSEGEATILTHDYARKPAYSSLLDGLRSLQKHSIPHRQHRPINLTPKQHDI
jgi:endo-1,4-beta-xylanase